MPYFRRWFWEQVFSLLSQLEKRDVFIAVVSTAMFVLIWSGKISGDNLAAIITGIAGYLIGRPNSRRREDE
jgi:hypothetical protein